MNTPDTVLSGMRPSGKLHLGNYFGALINWVQLQNQYRCFYMVADWHALTSEYADTSGIESNIWEMVLDWLSAGLDPEKCVIFRQSWVHVHADLFLLLSMMVPLSWLERCPTYKEQMQEIKQRDLSTYGFLGYPLLQAADILLYKASKVPVGEDQLPHIEITREICRRFNHFYGPILREPQALLTQSPKVPGIDGRKMSKSYNNAVYLSDTAVEIQAKVKRMYTDPKKIRRDDKGDPSGCVVFALHHFYTPEVQEIETRCRAGTLGCVDCKARLTQTLNAGLEPIRQKRAEWVGKKSIIQDIVRSGSEQAAGVAEKTMSSVFDAMKLKRIQGVRA